jgi:hypothetical protein
MQLRCLASGLHCLRSLLRPHKRQGRVQVAHSPTALEGGVGKTALAEPSALVFAHPFHLLCPNLRTLMKEPVSLGVDYRPPAAARPGPGFALCVAASCTSTSCAHCTAPRAAL